METMLSMEEVIKLRSAISSLVISTETNQEVEYNVVVDTLLVVTVVTRVAPADVDKGGSELSGVVDDDGEGCTTVVVNVTT